MNLRLRKDELILLIESEFPLDFRTDTLPYLKELNEFLHSAGGQTICGRYLHSFINTALMLTAQDIPNSNSIDEEKFFAFIGEAVNLINEHIKKVYNIILKKSVGQYVQECMCEAWIAKTSDAATQVVQSAVTVRFSEPSHSTAGKMGASSPSYMSAFDFQSLITNGFHVESAHPYSSQIAAFLESAGGHRAHTNALTCAMHMALSKALSNIQKRSQNCSANITREIFLEILQIASEALPELLKQYLVAPLTPPPAECMRDIMMQAWDRKAKCAPSHAVSPMLSLSGQHSASTQNVSTLAIATTTMMTSQNAGLKKA